MLVVNASTVKTHTVAGVPIYPGTSATIPDEYYDDIAANADLSVSGGHTGTGTERTIRHPAVIVSSSDPVNGDGMPDGTVWIKTA